ncbi:MAG: hypothetical protein FWD17_08980 [Polyangiaceae bacterium]|nr:hypothetical protein [Polyangiaceae bacterium]
MTKGASVFLLAAAAGAGTFAFTRPAAALGPIDVEVGARAGYGSSPYKSSLLSFNALGAGIGARAGVTFFNVYAGLSLMYYFGSSGNVQLTAPDGSSLSAHAAASSFMYGVEGGYNFSFLFLTIRPQLGIGNFQTHYRNFPTDLTGLGGGLPSVLPTTTHNIYIEPRATALVNIGIVYAGADIGVLLTPGLHDSKAAALVNGQLGVKF